MNLLNLLDTTIISSHPIKLTSFFIIASMIYYTNIDITNTAIYYSYKTLRFFTKMQLYSYNMFRRESSKSIIYWFCCCDTNKSGKELTLIRDGKIIDSINHTEQIPFNKDYDFIIHEISIDDENNVTDAYFVRYDNMPKCLEFKKIKRPFITGTITYNNKDYTIHNIDSISIANMIIFDRPYTQWYMNYFHKIQIYDDPYNISFLTTDCSQINISDKQYILFDDTAYHIKDCNNVNCKNDLTLALKLKIDSMNDNQNDLVWRAILTQEDINEKDNINTKEEGSSTSSSDSSYEIIE